MEPLLLPLFLLLLLLSPAASSSSSNSNSCNNKYQCDWCPRHSTASLFPPNYKSDEAAAAAACGYGDMTELLPSNGGVHHLAAASSDLFRDDSGACYQLRCTDRRLCGDDGVKVVVVTEKTNGTPGFLLTRDAFTAMARNGNDMSNQLAAGLLDNLQVDFRRIPCEYKKKNLAVRVELVDWNSSSSRKPRHLAIRFLYQGGLTDIAAVEIAQQQGGFTRWRSMTRRIYKQQGVWRTTIARAADGPLQLRFVVTAGSGGKWLRTALPADWRPGGVYDTGLQIADVAVRDCSRYCLSGDGNMDELASSDDVKTDLYIEHGVISERVA